MLSLIMIRFKRLPSDIMNRITHLKRFLQGDPNVIFAYFFGGITKGPPSPLSDVDLAIYVKDLKKIDYLAFFTDITNILGTNELDLVILNTAPISLSGRILQSRSIAVDKDPFFRHRYESLTLRKFFDFQARERAIIKRRYGIG